MYSEQALLQTLIEATLKNRMQWLTDTSMAQQAIDEIRDNDIVVTFYYEKHQYTLAVFYNEETTLTRLVFFDMLGEWVYEIDSEDEQDGNQVAILFDVISRQMTGVAEVIHSLISDFS